MTESELYKNLGSLTKSKDQWEENIPYVASLLLSESTKIKAKTLWLLGEMGPEVPACHQGRRSRDCRFLRQCGTAFAGARRECPWQNRAGLLCLHRTVLDWPVSLRPR